MQPENGQTLLDRSKMTTYRLDDVVNQLFRLIDLLFRICHNKTMQVFFLIASVSSVRSTFPFLNRALATNGDFGTGFGFHLLESIATRSDE